MCERSESPKQCDHLIPLREAWLCWNRPRTREGAGKKITKLKNMKTITCWVRKVATTFSLNLGIFPWVLKRGHFVIRNWTNFSFVSPNQCAQWTKLWSNKMQYFSHCHPSNPYLGCNRQCTDKRWDWPIFQPSVLLSGSPGKNILPPVPVSGIWHYHNKVRTTINKQWFHSVALCIMFRCNLLAGGYFLIQKMPHDAGNFWPSARNTGFSLYNRILLCI